MNVKWRLRMTAAQREVWTGAQLRRLLAERAGLELSAAFGVRPDDQTALPVEAVDACGDLHRARMHT